jgi:PPP family 3-phenylpropionic acid transporter
MIDSIAPRNVIWLIAAAWVAAAVYAVRLFPLAGTPAPEGTEPSHLELLRRPGFIAVAVAAGLIQASHAVYYGFSTLDWSAAGLDGTAVGMLWALGVVAEITLFALSGRLPPALGPAALLLLGAVGAVVRWTVMAFDPPTLALPFLQCLHALSFGATYLGALGFVAQAAPPGLAATAQGYLATVLGGLMAVSMGLSGVLYAAFGSLAYLAMAVLAAAGGVFALMARQSAPQSPP